MTVLVLADFINEQNKLDVTKKLEVLLKRVCCSVLKNEGLEGNFEVSITFTDNEGIREINRAYRHIDRETDVLSFPLSQDGIAFDVDMSNGAKMLGDIVISLEKGAAQAKEFGHSYEREIGYLTAHSMLHLLGYDHVEGSTAPIEKFGHFMRDKEEAALVPIGLTR